MDIIQAVLNVWTTIWNWFWILIKTISNLFSSIVNLVSYLIWIIKALFYWLWSLLSWVRNLLVNVFDWWVFSSVWLAFNQLTTYIWVPAVVFMASLFLVIIVRIWIAFVFKLLRLNIDYHSLNNKTRTINQHDSLKDHR